MKVVNTLLPRGRSSQDGLHWPVKVTARVEGAGVPTCSDKPAASQRGEAWFPRPTQEPSAGPSQPGPGRGGR